MTHDLRNASYDTEEPHSDSQNGNGSDGERTWASSRVMRLWPRLREEVGVRGSAAPVPFTDDLPAWLSGSDLPPRFGEGARGEAVVEAHSDHNSEGPQRVEAKIGLEHLLMLLETEHGDTPYTQHFTTRWKLQEYEKTEIPSDKSLSDILVAVGEPDAAWITKCRDYVAWYVPDIGVKVLDIIELRLRSPLMEISDHNVRTSSGSNFRLSIRTEGGNLSIVVHDSVKVIGQVARVLTFLATALQPYPRVSWSNAELFSREHIRLRKSDAVLEINEGELAWGRATICWPDVCRGTIITTFPVPSREEFSGAEIPLDLMLALAEIRDEIHICGFVLFGGMDIVLFPTAMSADSCTIQWHVVSMRAEIMKAADPNQASQTELGRLTAAFGEIDYQSIVATLDASLKKLEPLTIGELRKKRHILGYSKYANVFIGTRSYRLQVPNQRCGSTTEQSRMFFRRRVHINFGTSGMSMISSGATVEVGFTRSQIAKLDPTPVLYRQVSASARRPVLLYDTTRLTAYLVPELSVVLHIVFSYFANLGGLKETELEKLPRARLVPGGGDAASKCIITACLNDLKLEGSQGETWSFADALKDALTAMRSCRGMSLEVESEKPLRERFPSKDIVIHGWDMADFVANEETMFRQEVRVSRATAETWVNYVARHKKMLVVFAKDLDTPIVLDNPHSVCSNWDPLPRTNLLLCSSQCMKDLMQTCGGDVDTGRLTDQQCYYHQCDEKLLPFQSCLSSGKPHCNKLHYLSSSPSNQIADLPAEGAILLGSTARGESETCRLWKAWPFSNGAEDVDGGAERDLTPNEPMHHTKTSQKEESPRAFGSILGSYREWFRAWRSA